MPQDELTEREYDILEGLAAGESNAEIAERLILSVETVRWYSKQIYSKLGVNNRTQAGMKAQELGLFQTEETPAIATGILTDVPHYYSSFVGRDEELADITQLLTAGEVRLLSIVGPGGAGKTRLAVEVTSTVADHYANGVYFVPLDATITDDESFLLALRRIVACGTDNDVFDILSNQHSLIIFDNFEQSREQTPLVHQLIETCPHIHILVTSQVSLNLSHEWVRRIGNLVEDNNAGMDAALQLFADRVNQVWEDFSLADHQACATEICKLIHGSPLAIELIAAWFKTITCTDILEELRNSPDILAATANDITMRHQSVKAVFEHTWNLLPPRQQSIFKRLAVFRGEFGLAAARQVAGADLQDLSTLVDWSLIYRTQSGLYKVHGLLRHYAEQKLIGQQHGMESKMAFAMVSLMRGDFNRVEEVADKLMEESSDELNVDKGFALGILGLIAGAQEDYAQCLQLCEASLTITEDNPLAVYFSHLGLSIGYLGTDDTPSALAALKRVLQTTQILQSTAFTVLYLPVLSLLKLRSDEPEWATQVYSLANHHGDSLPEWMTAWAHAQKLVPSLQYILGEESFEEHWATGKELNLKSIHL